MLWLLRDKEEISFRVSNSRKTTTTTTSGTEGASVAPQSWRPRIVWQEGGNTVSLSSGSKYHGKRWFLLEKPNEAERSQIRTSWIQQSANWGAWAEEGKGKDVRGKSDLGYCQISSQLQRPNVQTTTDRYMPPPTHQTGKWIRWQRGRQKGKSNVK